MKIKKKSSNIRENLEISVIPIFFLLKPILIFLKPASFPCWNDCLFQIKKYCLQHAKSFLRILNRFRATFCKKRRETDKKAHQSIRLIDIRWFVEKLDVGFDASNPFLRLHMTIANLKASIMSKTKAAHQLARHLNSNWIETKTHRIDKTVHVWSMVII